MTGKVVGDLSTPTPTPAVSLGLQNPNITIDSNRALLATQFSADYLTEGSGYLSPDYVEAVSNSQRNDEFSHITASPVFQPSSPIAEMALEDGSGDTLPTLEQSVGEEVTEMGDNIQFSPTEVSIAVTFAVGLWHVSRCII